jgi:hypothetical protein
VEYACHVRDLLVPCDYRLDLMLTRDDPLFANWDQDEAAVTHLVHEAVRHLYDVTSVRYGDRH